MKNKTVLTVCILFLFALSAKAYEPYMNKILNSWIGYPLDALISVWGYPDREKTIADRQLYIWEYFHESYGYNHSGRSTGYYVTPNDYNNCNNSDCHHDQRYNHYDYFCRRTIEVDKNKIIKEYEWQGSGCPTGYYYGKRLINPANDFYAIEKAEKAKIKAEKKAAKEKQKAEKKAAKEKQKAERK